MLRLPNSTHPSDRQPDSLVHFARNMYCTQSWRSVLRAREQQRVCAGVHRASASAAVQPTASCNRLADRRRAGGNLRRPARNR